MRILIFGRYDPDYSRNAVILQGLRLNHIDVAQCAIEPTDRFWTLRLLWRFVRMRPEFDVMVVAFPGQEVMLLARLLTRKPIIFDAFTSHYEGYVEDRKIVSPSSLRARWYSLIDGIACRFATAILTDTREHAKYYTQRYGVPDTKLHTVLLGTVMKSVPATTAYESFLVHFHGSNIPLQGIDTIWGAARRIWNQPVRFQMVGPFTVPAELLPHVSHEEHVPFPELASQIARAQVCLGIFGTSSKTRRVIPNKVYEALAMSKPVITSDTPAIRELLDDSSAVLIPQGDSDALVRAIMQLKSDSALCERTGRAGNKALMTRATPAILGAHVAEIAQGLL